MGCQNLLLRLWLRLRLLRRLLRCSCLHAAAADCLERLARRGGVAGAWGSRGRGSRARALLGLSPCGQLREALLSCGRGLQRQMCLLLLGGLRRMAAAGCCLAIGHRSLAGCLGRWLLHCRSCRHCCCLAAAAACSRPAGRGRRRRGAAAASTLDAAVVRGARGCPSAGSAPAVVTAAANTCRLLLSGKQKVGVLNAL